MVTNINKDLWSIKEVKAPLIDRFLVTRGQKYLSVLLQ